jgi:hypothetical protein
MIIIRSKTGASTLGSGGCRSAFAVARNPATLTCSQTGPSANVAAGSRPPSVARRVDKSKPDRSVYRRLNDRIPSLAWHIVSHQSPGMLRLSATPLDPSGLTSLYVTTKATCTKVRAAATHLRVSFSSCVNSVSAFNSWSRSKNSSKIKMVPGTINDLICVRTKIVELYRSASR